MNMTRTAVALTFVLLVGSGIVAFGSAGKKLDPRIECLVGMVEKRVGVSLKVERHTTSKVFDRLRQKLTLQAISKSKFPLGSIDLTFETVIDNTVHKTTLDREKGCFSTSAWRSAEPRILQKFRRWLKKWERECPKTP